MKALALVALAAATAHADGDDARVLFAEGRFAAAAQVFEHRWSATGNAVDGVNAVVSWRTAGRYARAAALLAKVRASKAPPTGDAAATAAELDERLQTLTATITIDGPLDAAAVISSDADPVERVGSKIVVDVGEHDLRIAQAGCEPFSQPVTAYPGGQETIEYKPSCDQSGTLHVYLGGDRDSELVVDGKPYRASGQEADLKLAPGEHALHVEAHDRPVLDEPVAVHAHETTALRVRYPWRARDLGIILGITSASHASNDYSGITLGLTAGLWSSRFRVTFDFGSMISDAPWGLNKSNDGGTIGRPWLADTAAYHLFSSPLWTGKLGPYRLAFDHDPIAIRFDEARTTSYAGLFVRCEEGEAILRSFSFLPFALSADGPYVHSELTLWPLSYITYRSGSACGTGDGPTTTGWGAMITLLGGWRI